jgi:hypothetical protein
MARRTFDVIDMTEIAASSRASASDGMPAPAACHLIRRPEAGH